MSYKRPHSSMRDPSGSQEHRILGGRCTETNGGGRPWGAWQVDRGALTLGGACRFHGAGRCSPLLTLLWVASVMWRKTKISVTCFVAHPLEKLCFETAYSDRKVCLELPGIFPHLHRGREGDEQGGERLERGKHCHLCAPCLCCHLTCETRRKPARFAGINTEKNQVLL